MTLTWITEVANHTDHTVLLRQTDPSKNPVIDEVTLVDGMQRSAALLPMWASIDWPLPTVGTDPAWTVLPDKPAAGKWFLVGPRTLLKTSYFVVPWSDQIDPFPSLEVQHSCVYLIVNKGDAPITKEFVEGYGVKFNIVPSPTGKYDFIQFFYRDGSPIDAGTVRLITGGTSVIRALFAAGPAGGAHSTTGRLNITDDSITYDIISVDAYGDVLDGGKEDVGKVLAQAAANKKPSS